jgi:hypothetical protein
MSLVGLYSTSRRDKEGKDREGSSPVTSFPYLISRARILMSCHLSFLAR